MDSNTFRLHPSPLRTPAGHCQVIPSAVHLVWGHGVSLPGVFRQGDLRLSDLASEVSPKTVQVEDNEALRHLTVFLEEIKQRQGCHVGTQLWAGHQSSGSLHEEKEGERTLELLAGVVG